MKNLLIFILVILIFSCNSNKEVPYQKSDLESMSLSDLRIKRNEIFAKHGYIFKSDELKDYFSKFYWYEPIQENVDSLLTETDKLNIELILEVEKEIKKYIIKTDDSLIAAYKKQKVQYHKGFVDQLINTIEKFEDRKADTTVYQIANIDNIGGLDTIKNRIYCLNGNVILNTSWTRNGIKLWEEEIMNPFLWLNDSDEFRYETRESWVPFTIGIYYAIPDIKNISDYPQIDKQTALRMAIDWSKRKKINISETDYSKYLENFEGDIIGHGDPENRHELLIWYEPINDFLLFYAP